MRYDLQYYESKLRDGNVTPNNLRKWVDKLDIIIHVAKNEGRPWTEDMLGYPTMDMPLKKDTGYNQTGDYHMYINTYDKYVGIIGERKSISDMFGTTTTGRDRFIREIERYKIDPRFSVFVVFVEGSRDEYMRFRPVFKGKRFDRKAAAVAHKGVPHMVDAKHGGILALFADGVAVSFAETRADAAKDFIHTCQIWCRHNYMDILDINH